MKNYRLLLERKKGEQQLLTTHIKEKTQSMRLVGRKIRNLSEALPIVQIVVQQTQEELKYQISELVTLALSAVFDDPYTFNIEFVLKNKKTDAVLSFIRDNEKINPYTSSGGGALDVASFALRMTAWKMHNPKVSSILILDEPFKHLKGVQENARAIQMVKQLSDKLKLQVIMISDERVPISEIEKGADKIFVVTNSKGVATIKEEKITGGK